jgi:hypothetical protein
MPFTATPALRPVPAGKLRYFPTRRSAGVKSANGKKSSHIFKWVRTFYGFGFVAKLSFMV